MPDRWGRPTMSDGLRVFQTARVIQSDREHTQDRATNKEAYDVAAAMQSGQDTSGYSPEAKYKGSQLYWNESFNKLRNEREGYLTSQAGMTEKINKIQLNLAQAGEKMKRYKAARAAGNDDLARQIAMQIGNEHMYNGRYIEPVDNGYKVTNWDGSEEKITDIPIEQVDQLLGAYFDKPYEEIVKWSMNAEQLRSQRNQEIISQAEPWINEKTGQIIYRVPAGVWGPDGKPRGAFFVDDPMAQDEVPSGIAKNFKRFDVAQAKKGVMKQDYINPGNVVTQDKKAGLLVSGEQGPEFKEISGGLDVASGGGGEDSSLGAKRDFELKVKRLETELMPFSEKGANVLDENTYQLTNDGRNALMSAINLVQKYQNDPNSLSEKELAILPNAHQAVQIFKSISQENTQAFGLQGQGVKTIPPPPAGATLD